MTGINTLRPLPIRNSDLLTTGVDLPLDSSIFHDAQRNDSLESRMEIVTSKAFEDLNFSSKASEDKDVELIFQLLRSSADASFVCAFLKGREDIKAKTLAQAAIRGDLFTLSYLLDDKTPRESLLKKALNNNRLHVIDFLLKKGAILTFQERKKALLLAVKEGNTHLIKKLLDGFNSLIDPAIQEVLKLRQIDTLAALVDLGITINASDCAKALDIAAGHSHLELILKLLEQHQHLRCFTQQAAARYGNFRLLHALFRKELKILDNS